MNIRKSFFIEIILPTLLALVLLIATVFFLILPFVEQSLMDRKKELLREEVATVFSLLNHLRQRAEAGEMTPQAAQAQALETLRHLHYGSEFKDYFWVTDMGPTMLMHPYRPDLEGSDLSEFRDAAGKRLFMDILGRIRDDGWGFADYMWQWQDDSHRVVPKLSFVRRFDPWGWIVGTGVYVDDVRLEIRRITRHMVWGLSAVTGLIGIILFYLTNRSLKIERERSAYEQSLKESRERYKALLESTTEGVLLLVDGRPVYANRTLLQMLGYGEAEFAALDLADMFADRKAESHVGYRFFMDMLAGRDHPPQFEAVLRRKDGRDLDAALLCSPMVMGEHSGISVIVRDVSAHKAIAERFDQSIRSFHFLAENINVGVLRVSTGRGGRVVEANTAALAILGYADEAALLGVAVDELFPGPGEKDLLASIIAAGAIKGRTVPYAGGTRTMALSAVAVRDEKGFAPYVNIVIEDVTARTLADQAQSHLIAEMQTALQFLNLPVGRLASPLPATDAATSIRQAARRMTELRSSLLAVTDGNHRVIGIVTEGDLRRKVVSGAVSPDAPVAEVMTTAIISLPENAMVFEATLLMGENDIRHLVLTDPAGIPSGFVGTAELLQSQRYSLAYLMQTVARAEAPEHIFQVRPMLETLALALIDADTDPRTTTRILVTVSEAITQKCIRLAIDRLGPPPARFEFLSMGSQGRFEQTLKTDQDNAILFEDVEPEREEAVQGYFLELGRLVCGWLDTAGYQYCEGGVMAQNPKWCQPLTAWKKRFHGWVSEATPQDLLDTKIFFDFRRVYGSDHMAGELHAFLDMLLDGNAVFFYNLAQNSLLFKPPLGLFRSIRTESIGQSGKGFSLKKAMTPIVDFGRVYALRRNIHATNTLERLRLLNAAGHLSDHAARELESAYVSLMRLRLTAQARSIRATGKPENVMDARTMAHLEVVILKELFSQITIYQKKMGLDFMGSTA
ncbi:DUF294 nucleotidyltransferase-like domain-containing protein [Solidesulfovibrio sp.]